MTVSDLVRVNAEGKIVEGGKPGRQVVTEAGAIVGLCSFKTVQHRCFISFFLF